MFSSVRLVLTLSVLSLVPKVITTPVYIPSTNSYLSPVQPVYSNFLTPNVNQPYNCIPPAQSYQQIYGSPIYQPYRSPCCLKQYIDPYKKLFTFQTSPYSQPGDSQFLFDVQQVYQMPPYRLSQTYLPSSNYRLSDFVGSQAPNSKTERDHGTKWNSRESGGFDGKDEKLLNVATSSYVNSINSPQGTKEKSCVKGIKLKTSGDNQQVTTKNNKYSSNYSNEEMKRTEEKVSPSEEESENDPIDEIEYQKIMNYLKKQINEKLLTTGTKTSKNDSRSNSINYSSKNMKDHTQSKNFKRD